MNFNLTLQLLDSEHTKIVTNTVFVHILKGIRRYQRDRKKSLRRPTKQNERHPSCYSVAKAGI